MTIRAEAPAGTGASEKHDDFQGVKDDGTEHVSLTSGCLDRDEAVPVDPTPVPCAWTLDPERLRPDERSSPVQWGVYLRSLEPEAEIRLNPSEVVRIGRSVGFSDQEIVEMLAAFTTSTARPEPEAQEVPTACPTPDRKWGIDLRTGATRAWWADCDRWPCPVCGRRKTARYRSELHIDFDHSNGAWVGEYPHSEEATARVRQRRARARSDGWTVLSRSVRIGDAAMEISSAPLPGSRPPTTGVWMTPDDLVNYLSDRLDAGRSAGVRVGPRAGWPQQEPCDEQAPQRQSAFKVFGKASAELQNRIVEQVRDEAMEEFGVDALDEVWYERVPIEWLIERFDGVWAVADAERRGRRGGSDVTDSAW